MCIPINFSEEFEITCVYTGLFSEHNVALRFCSWSVKNANQTASHVD